MKNYKVNVPENFNFGYDIVDAWAEKEPDKIAKHLSEELRDQQVIWKGQYIRIHNKIYIHMKKKAKVKFQKDDISSKVTAVEKKRLVFQQLLDYTKTEGNETVQ